MIVVGVFHFVNLLQLTCKSALAKANNGIVTAVLNESFDYLLKLRRVSVWILSLLIIWETFFNIYIIKLLTELMFKKIVLYKIR